MLGPRFIPESVFYTQSVVCSLQSVFYTDRFIPGLDVATCGVANATGFGPLATNFSRVVASLATAISSYYFIFIYFFIS